MKTIGLLMLLVLVTLPAYLNARADSSWLSTDRPASIDEAPRVPMPGNVHPLARTEFDRGPAASNLPMNRMLLVLKRSAQQKATLKQLISDQHNPSSSRFHKWLTPDEFGAQFGPASNDIQVISGWLQAHGLRVTSVARGRTTIEFSGNAGQVEDAFHTEIHKYVVNGEEHWANVSDPSIPAPLLPVVSGVATLHNFRSKPTHVLARQQIRGATRMGPGIRPAMNLSGLGINALSPADFSEIYKLDGLRAQNIDGTGTTIAVVARSNLNVQDIIDFQSTFDLPINPPQVIVNGVDPGIYDVDEELEAVLDAEWSGATAPGATVKFVVSASTEATDGVFLSEQYIVDNNLADVMTESFGLCEAYSTRAYTDVIESVAQQAAAEGITYLVASGDSGSSGCDATDSVYASGPLSVNVLASTPYTVAIGGTEFNDASNLSAYWSPSNGPDGKSALSYIPETTWNESTNDGGLGLAAGGGGVSQFFSKPEWQTGTPGIPNDGMRDVPDVSLNAASYSPYLVCMSGSCEPDANGDISLYLVFGTSPATASFAGIVANIDQIAKSRQGQADYILYALSATAGSDCIDSNARSPVEECVFHDITTGNNAVPQMPESLNNPQGLYAAGPGYDQATGLGSINALLLSRSWLSITEHTISVNLPKGSLSFPSQSVGVLSAPQSFVIENNSSSTLTVGNLLVTGANANEFSATKTCFPWVAPGATCTVWVTFTPQAAGTRTAAIAVNGQQIVSLSGTGSGVGTFEIVNKLSGLVLEAQGNSTTTGAPIDQSNFNGGANQQWQFVPVEDGYYEIVNQLSGKVMDVANSSTDDGAAVHQWDYWGGDNQKWQIEAIEGFYYKIVNKLSGKALDMSGLSLVDGGLANQWAYWAGDNQQWQLVPVQYYEFANKFSGKAMDVADMSNADYAAVHQWGFWGGANQEWQLIPIDESYFEIVNKLSGKALTDSNESTLLGSSMEQLTFTGDDSQKWQMTPEDGNYWKFINKLTGKALEVGAWSQSDGGVIQQWDYLGNDNQQWRVSPMR